MLNKTKNRLILKVYITKKLIIGKKINNKKIILKKNYKLKNYKLICLYNSFDRYLISGSKNVCSIQGIYRANFNIIYLNRHSIRFFSENSSLPNFSKTSW